MPCYQCSHCNKCGMFSLKLDLRCSTCGEPIVPGEASCGKCGTPYRSNMRRGRIARSDNAAASPADSEDEQVLP